MKKLKVFQIVIIALFLIFLIFIFRAVNYTKEYTVNNVAIVESYDKENDMYYFTLTYNDVTFDYLYESNYKQKRTFIEDVKLIEDGDNFCLIPSGVSLEFIPLCIDNGTITYYQEVNDNLKAKIPEEYLKEIKEESDTYQNISIYNRDYTYLLWNYDGFYYINEDEEKEIVLFDKEKYNITLVGYTSDYLVIADYDEEYTFNKFYRISFKDGAVKEYDLDYNIYFDSYFPGYENNLLYIVDNNEELMYEWNAKNGDLEKTRAKILNDGKWKSVGIKSLINQNKKFTYKSNYTYQLNDSLLTLNYTNKDIETQIATDVTGIVRVKDNLVFYLKTDTLYVFNPLTGNTKLLNYFEWNFNYQNMIYIN